MSDLLSSIAGGGGFITKSAVSTIVVALGATGTIATIPAVAGQRIILTGLASSGATQTNLTSVVSNSVTLVNAVILIMAGATTPTAANQFKLGFGTSNQREIVGEIGQAFDINTDVATSQGTAYTYQYTT